MVKGTRQEILKRIGESIKSCRLRDNITQRVLAERSGVSLNAVRHLESGAGATLATFVQVCRILRKDGWISALEPKDEISPIAFAETLKAKRSKPRSRASATERGRT